MKAPSFILDNFIPKIFINKNHKSKNFTLRKVFKIPETNFSMCFIGEVFPTFFVPMNYFHLYVIHAQYTVYPKHIVCLQEQAKIPVQNHKYNFSNLRYIGVTCVAILLQDITKGKFSLAINAHSSSYGLIIFLNNEGLLFLFY